MFNRYPCFFSMFACFLLAISFVASLYVWNSPLHRNHPSTIKKRFCSVFVMMIISPLIMKNFIFVERFQHLSLFELLGIRLPGLITASVLPLLLTMVLFLGPLCMQGLSGLWKLYSEPRFLMSSLCDLILIRNVVVAPLAEEFTFRACMMPLLLQCFKPTTAIFVCPLFFGFAHAHHMLERIKSGISIKDVIIIACFQFSYTFIFGAYSALLLVKTGHFVAPFLAHAFCNLMGFPDFNEVLSHKNPKKSILIFLFVAGVVLWYNLLTPLTNHSLYSNDVFWVGNQ